MYQHLDFRKIHEAQFIFICVIFYKYVIVLFNNNFLLCVHMT